MSTEHLSDQQIARIEALQAAKAVGVKTTGPFGGATPPETQDLVDLAEYILNGTHPMDRYYEEMQKERYGDADNVHDA